MIHPTAIVDPAAELEENIAIGPYSIIGAGVHIGRDTTIGAHCVIEGPTTIGRRNRIGNFVALGGAAQDKKYRGEATTLEIGDDNTIREFCTFNRGTEQGGGVTRVGSGNWIMAYVHIAHDCQVGNHTVFANNASLAGHVSIGDYVVMGGFALVYQFVRIGDYSICAFSAGVKQNVPPYAMVAGMPAHAAGINLEGLRRAQFSRADIELIERAYRTLYRRGLRLEEARAEIERWAQTAPVLRPLSAFLRATGKRGLIR